MIREITKEDFKIFWPTFESIIRAKETYAFKADMSFEEAYKLWCLNPLKTFVYEEEGQILGSYFIKENAMGPGSHICNCGYMVSKEARGKGIASVLCEHSQKFAIKQGFKAMQFNCVVSSNEIAVRLWKKLGFNIVGTIPKAYNHSKLGYVDAYVMYKQF